MNFAELKASMISKSAVVTTHVMIVSSTFLNSWTDALFVRIKLKAVGVVNVVNLERIQNLFVHRGICFVGSALLINAWCVTYVIAVK